MCSDQWSPLFLTPPRHQVSPYLSDAEFEPERVYKASVAACGLCKWVRAMMSYYEVKLEVGPKIEALRAAEASVELAEAKLVKSRRDLDEIVHQLQEIESSYAEIDAERSQLEARLQATGDRLRTATKLIGSLGGERVRWGTRSRELAEQLSCLVGDMTLCAAMCTYLGPFDRQYRAEGTREWLGALQRRGIRCSSTRSLVKVR